MFVSDTAQLLSVLLGAFINAGAKFLRDQFGIDWLPI